MLFQKTSKTLQWIRNGVTNWNRQRLQNFVATPKTIFNSIGGWFWWLSRQFDILSFAVLTLQMWVHCVSFFILIFHSANIVFLKGHFNLWCSWFISRGHCGVPGYHQGQVSKSIQEQVHQAEVWKYHEDPEAMFQANHDRFGAIVQGTLRLFNACRHHRLPLPTALRFQTLPPAFANLLWNPRRASTRPAGNSHQITAYQ